MPLPQTYRDQIGAAALDTRPIDDGGAARAEALANTFSQFKNTAFQIGTKIRTDEGQAAGQIEGATGKPDFKSGFKALTAYGAAYNDAATRSYAIKADGDAAVTAARLEQEANGDPELYKVTMSAARDATVNAAPPEARGVLGDIYNQRLSSGYVRVQSVQMKAIESAHRATLADGVDQQTQLTASMLASPDPRTRMRAVLEHEKGTMMIDAARLDGTISSEEADALHQRYTYDVIAGTHLAEFRQELEKGANGDPAGYIANLDERNKTDNALPPDEEVKLHAALMASMRDYNQLEAERHRNDQDEQKIRWAAGEKDVTERLLRNSLTDSYLLKMVHSNDLDPQIARTLRSTLHSPEAEKSDPATLQFFKLNLLDEGESVILSNPKLTMADRTALVEERRRETAPGAWQSTQEYKIAEDKIDLALKIIPGSIDAKMIEADPAKYQTWQDARDALKTAIEGTDPAQRQGHMVEIANKVVKENITKANVAAVQQAQKGIDELKRRVGDPGKLSRAERDEYNKKLASRQAQLDAAQRGQQ